MNFLAPIRHGAVLGHGQVVHGGRTLIVSEVVVKDEEDRPVARGLVTLMILTSGQRTRPKREGSGSDL